MPERTDIEGQVVQFSAPVPKRSKTRDQQSVRLRQAARRTEALQLVLAGLTYAQVGERLGITESGAYDLVQRTLATAENRSVESARALENARLDRAQAAIWTQVVAGEVKAVAAFLRISERRAKMNGLDAPTQLNLSVNVRAEMERAMRDLELLVLGEVVPRELPAASD